MHDHPIDRLKTILLEIVDLIKNAKSLRDNEQKFRSLFEYSQDAVFMTTPADTIEDANPAACEMFSRTRQELCSLKRADLLDVEDPGFSAAFRKRQETGNVKGVELTAIRKNGERFTVELDSLILPVQPPRAFVIMRDISERKGAESLLRDSEEQKRLALEAAHLGTWEYSPETQQIFWDERTREIFGVSRDEVIDMAKVMSLVHPEDQKRIGKGIAIGLDPLRGEGHFETEYRIRLPDGEVRWISVNGKRYTESRGSERKVVRVVGTHMDTTERKRAEETLRKMNETLEQQIAERTELARDRAKQLQALAIELIESEEKERRRLASLLHDDLQQTLAAARFQLQNLPHLPEIGKALQLLDFSIEKSRRLSYDLSPPVLLHASLIDALKWLARQVREQFGLQVVLQECGNEDVDSSVKSFLFRAVQELLFNIRKHAGVDKAEIAVRRSEDTLNLIVSDKGRGVGELDLGRLPNKAGFGLLTIKERANFMGGDLTIDSAPGQGSQFTISLPLQSR